MGLFYRGISLRFFGLNSVLNRFQKNQKDLEERQEKTNEKIYELKIKINKILVDIKTLEGMDDDDSKNKKDRLEEKHSFLVFSRDSILSGDVIDHPIPITIMDTLSKKYIRHGIETKPISVEIDKMVGMSYFLIVLIAFTVSLSDSSFDAHFDDKVIMGLNQTIISLPGCVDGCVDGLKDNTWVIFLALSLISFIIGVVLFKNLQKLFKKIRTASIFLMAIQNGHGEEPVIKNLSEAMLDRRWELSESLSHRYVDDLDLEDFDTEKWIFKLKKEKIKNKSPMDF